MQSSKKFFPALEALRGLAAVSVVLYHAAWVFPGRELSLVRNGYLWVDFFFVLSGFVISQSASDRLSSRADLVRFVVQRLSRIYPLHLVTLLALLLFECARALAQSRGAVSDVPAFSVNSPWALLVNLVLLHAAGLTSSLSFNAPSWSIGAEFWVYLVFALSVSLAPKLRLLAPVGLIAVFAAWLAWHRPANLDVSFDLGVLRCGVGFFLGVLLQRLPRVTLAPALLPLALIAMLAFLSLKARGPSDFAAPLIFAAVIAAVVFTGKGGMLETRPLLWLGKVSYSVYMVHQLVLMLTTGLAKKLLHPTVVVTADGTQVLQLSPLIGAGLVVLTLALVLGASALSFRFIEEPFRKRARAWAALS